MKPSTQISQLMRTILMAVTAFLATAVQSAVGVTEVGRAYSLNF